MASQERASWPAAPAAGTSPARTRRTSAARTTRRSPGARPAAGRARPRRARAGCCRSSRSAWSRPGGGRAAPRAPSRRTSSASSRASASPFRAVTFGGKCEAGSWSRKRSTATISPTWLVSYSKTPPFPTSRSRLGAGDLARDRLADQPVGVELRRVLPVLVPGEELRVLLGAGRILACHPAQPSAIALACSACPSRRRPSSTPTARATARPSRSRSRFSGAGLDFFTRAKADALLELAAARVGPPEGLGFLDVGCGPGETDRFLEGRVARLAGVDVAPEMVERARERNPWAEYRGYAAGEPIPFEDASFDVSFAICVFHHVGRARAAPAGAGDGQGHQAGRADRAVRAQPAQPADPQGGPRAASSTGMPTC